MFDQWLIASEAGLLAEDVSIQGRDTGKKSCSNSPPQLDAGDVGVELDVQDVVLGHASSRT